jgi:hypothetical protein
MSRLEIKFVETTDSVWEHLVFKQEGMAGFTLQGAYLPEFVEALENNKNKDTFYFWENYSITHTGSKTELRIYPKTAPLLVLDEGQRAKLIVHLKTEYASML